MMGPTLYCDRARMWASLAVDGEISEAERDSLRAHVAVCPACEAWAVGVVDLAQALRTAPLVEPGRTLFRPPPVRSRRIQVRAVQLAAAAAAIAAAVGLGHLAAALTSPVGGKAPSRAAIAATQEPYVEQQQLALLGRAGRIPRGRALAV